MGLKKGSCVIKQKLGSVPFGWKEFIEYNGSHDAFSLKRQTAAHLTGRLRRWVAQMTR